MTVPTTLVKSESCHPPQKTLNLKYPKLLHICDDLAPISGAAWEGPKGRAWQWEPAPGSDLLEKLSQAPLPPGWMNSPWKDKPRYYFPPLCYFCQGGKKANTEPEYQLETQT